MKVNQGIIKVQLLAFPRICLLDLRNTDFMTLQQVVKIEIPAARVSERTLPPQYSLWKQQTQTRKTLPPAESQQVLAPTRGQ